VSELKKNREAIRPLLRVTDLCKHFSLGRGFFGGKGEVLRAVDGVSFEIARGETLGLVGESGCGKTTLGRVLLRLLPLTSGSVLFDGIDLSRIDSRALRALRRRMQIIFQDPFSSLNPRMTVEAIVSEGIRIFRLARGTEAVGKVLAILEKVGLPADALHRYPHEFSGGQRQRIGIARALAIDPDFVVCDEPVSALDVSVQAQVLNLLIDLKDSMGLSYLFISHDLSVVKHIADRVAVMYLGRVVEMGETDSLFGDPRHPYTRALISAVPLPDPKGKRKRIILEGDVPSPIDPPPGCHFHTRCPEARPECSRKEPPVRSDGTGSFYRCVLK
jgi:oligopeptide transport system ATP-binding protein